MHRHDNQYALGDQVSIRFSKDPASQAQGTVIDTADNINVYLPSQLWYEVSTENENEDLLFDELDILDLALYTSTFLGSNGDKVIKQQELQQFYSMPL